HTAHVPAVGRRPPRRLRTRARLVSDRRPCALHSGGNWDTESRSAARRWLRRPAGPRRRWNRARVAGRTSSPIHPRRSRAGVAASGAALRGWHGRDAERVFQGLTEPNVTWFDTSRDGKL